MEYHGHEESTCHEKHLEGVLFRPLRRRDDGLVGRARHPVVDVSLAHPRREVVVGVEACRPGKKVEHLLDLLLLLGCEPVLH